MARLRGTGIGTGMAMGTVAVVRLRNGFPLAPPIPPRIVEMLSNPRLAETPDIVLVAEDYQSAIQIATSLQWARVVGIAAANDSLPDAPVSECPVVVNIPGLMERVNDDMLMVVDAIRGVVAADADGYAAMQYQAEHQFDNASKKRLYLDNSHLPATTRDGYTVQVIAQVSTLEELATAQEEGADALCVAYNSLLIPDEPDEKVMRQNMRVLTDLAAGKPLIVMDEYALAANVLLEAACRADVTVMVPPVEHLDGLGLRELSGELNTALTEMTEKNVACDMPRMGAYLPALGHLPTEPDALLTYIDRLSELGAARLIVGLESDNGPDDMLLPELDRLVAAAANDVLPVWMTVDPYLFFSLHALGDGTAFESALTLLVGTGAAGLIVIPTGVGQTKAAIQKLNQFECREALTRQLPEA